MTYAEEEEAIGGVLVLVVVVGGRDRGAEQITVARVLFWWK
jgi:hypothetical protein